MGKEENRDLAVTGKEEKWLEPKYSESIVTSPENALRRCYFLVAEAKQNIVKLIFALKEIHDYALYKYLGYLDFKEFVGSEFGKALPVSRAMEYLSIGQKFNGESALKLFGGDIKLLTKFAKDADYTDVEIGDSFVTREGERIPLEIFEAEISAKYAEKEKSLRDKIKKAKEDVDGKKKMLEKGQQRIDELEADVKFLQDQVDAVAHSDRKGLTESLGTERQVKGHIELAVRKALGELHELETLDLAKFAKNAQVRQFVTAQFKALEIGLSAVKEAWAGFVILPDENHGGKKK